MIVLSKEQIEEMVDPDQMMDQIEEAYRIYGSGEFYMLAARKEALNMQIGRASCRERV